MKSLNVYLTLLFFSETKVMPASEAANRIIIPATPASPTFVPPELEPDAADELVEVGALLVLEVWLEALLVEEELPGSPGTSTVS